MYDLFGLNGSFSKNSPLVSYMFNIMEQLLKLCTVLEVDQGKFLQIIFARSAACKDRSLGKI